MENKKHIWIINEYAGTPTYGQEFRHYYLAKELIKLDYQITIVSSLYSHLFKNQPKNKKENIDGVNYLWLKTFNYGNSHSKKRVLKWFLFMLKIFFLPFSLKKPDVIIVSPMAPFSILPAWMLAKIYKAKLIYEVKDIWPLSLVELGGFKSIHPFIKFMAWFEKFALKKSDIIVSNLQNYGAHIKKDIGLNRNFEWISNGVDLDELNQIEPLDSKIRNQIPKDKFIVGYVGSFGISNAINFYLQTINIIDCRYDIVFIFLGDGDMKNEIVKCAKKDKRIVVLDKVDKQTAFSVMSKSDLLFKGNPSHNIYKFGISPIKLFEYMLSATPIIHSTNVEQDIVKMSKSGISVEAENPNAIAKGIMDIYNMSQDERDTLGANGKKYVLEHFTYEKLAQKYKELF
jgi:glycosyltransferase involved in cell wall biosynthesis